MLDLVGIVLVMTVNPGFGGQKFIPSSCPRSWPCASFAKSAGWTRHRGRWRAQRGQRLAVIGAGATAIVAGSAVFTAPDYAKAIAAIRHSAAPRRKAG